MKDTLRSPIALAQKIPVNTSTGFSIPAKTPGEYLTLIERNFNFRKRNCRVFNAEKMGGLAKPGLVMVRFFVFKLENSKSSFPARWFTRLWRAGRLVACSEIRKLWRSGIL
ncbi:MAG: hypothetical protein RBS53_10735 [Bacteroidales bacterium]|nr:hypothetical protein [Bacteroidales bacterium]NLM92733.1 hypothetical protein [Bacteroidales bacterium]